MKAIHQTELDYVKEEFQRGWFASRAELGWQTYLQKLLGYSKGGVSEMLDKEELPELVYKYLKLRRELKQLANKQSVL